MTVTVVLLSAIAIIAMGALIWTLDRHEDEREAWAVERRELTNRAIARHAGEIVALDREGKPKPEREDSSPIFVEGLS